MNRRLFSFFLILMLLLVGVVGVSAQDVVPITIRCKSSPPEEDWRCNAFTLVEEQVEAELGIDIELTLIQDNMDWGDFKQEFELASEAGQAPDIQLSGHEHIGDWAPAGFIIPLDDMIPEYEAFNDVVPSLWESQMFQGQIFGIPQDAEARPVYYSKLLLADLGWSDEEIESLPERVAAGDFTFQNLIDTAEQAVEEGVVEEGNGFWHRPSNGPDFLYYYYGMGGEIMGDGGNLVVDRAALQSVFELMNQMTESGVMRADIIGQDWNTLWHPGVCSADTVLFAAGGTWNWGNWIGGGYCDQLGGFDYMLENIGMILPPAMDTGNPITLTHPLSYMISSESEHPDVALALIAAVTDPEINNLHAIGSAHLGITNAQLQTEDYQNDPVLSQAHYMLDFTTALPNHPGWGAWSTAYFTGIQAVESGDATPEEAVDIAVSQMQNEIEGLEVR